nr:UDP-2,3-diacylglucosamine diphosphatase [Azohydromonas aeria]
MHLDATRPRTFQAWIDYLAATPAQALFILGDLFEAWVGDDCASQPGFEANAIRALREASRQRWIGFMPGNRDFLLGSELLGACGVALLDDPTVLQAHGRRVLLSHGDQLCLADVEYLHFRAQVRQPAWQADFLTRSLRERLDLARAMRHASRQHQSDPVVWADVDPAAALAWMRETQCSDLVHGHTHRPGRHELAPGLQRLVLSDWEVDGPGDARAQALRLSRTGFEPMNLGV